jgi:hypothetical protein
MKLRSEPIDDDRLLAEPSASLERIRVREAGSDEDSPPNATPQGVSRIVEVDSDARKFLGFKAKFGRS